MTEQTFGTRLQAAMAHHGPLCAGIDPHRALVESWGLTYDLAGVERFTMTCVEAFGGAVAAVKPQSAFFEVFGAPGVAVLERALADLREAGTLTVLDVKRGDIGTTVDAYGEAFVGTHAPAPADAITLSPYLGYGSLRPALDLAAQTGRGVFVLALTSNPEGAQVQHARLADGALRRSVDAAKDQSYVLGVLTAGQLARALSTLCLSGTRLPPRTPSSAVITARQSASRIRSRRASGEKPPNTTECTAPMRAQASMA